MLFLPYRFVDHQEIEIIIQHQITLLITEMIYGPFFRFIDACEIIEVKSFVQKFLLIGLCFPVGIKLLENTPVLPENIIDIPDQVTRIAVKAVVVCIAAHVGTEFLVDTAAEFFAAFKAFAFFGHIVLSMKYF
jgi:hypothetical protein